jgi:hypothetical protein
MVQKLLVHFFEIQKENQLKVDSNELKVNWFQLKPFLINRFRWGLKGKSIESRLMSIERLSKVDHPESPRTGSQENPELLSNLKFVGGSPTLISIQHYAYAILTFGVSPTLGGQNATLCHWSWVAMVSQFFKLGYE